MIQLSMFYDDSTVRFDKVHGLGESYYIICPVCWNSSIRVTRWEDGDDYCEECVICRRMEELMELENLIRS